MLTICITSYNRGKYLDALLESITSECLQEKHQVVLVDNFSTEYKVFEAIETHKNIITDLVDRGKTDDRGHDWINDEYIAKNIHVELAKGDTILFLQDDLQYIGYPGLMLEYAIMFRMSSHHCMTCNAVRKSTIKDISSGVIYEDMSGIKAFEHKDQHYHTMGFQRTSYLKQYGKYKTDWPQQQEFWGRSEDWYDALIKRRLAARGATSRHCATISMSSFVPLFVPVWNDPRGGYAFIRGNKRYGHYIGPNENHKLFYRQFTKTEFLEMQKKSRPRAFVDVAKPLGWEYKVDSRGDQIKYPQSKILLEGPIHNINDE